MPAATQLPTTANAIFVELCTILGAVVISTVVTNHDRNHVSGVVVCHNVPRHSAISTSVDRNSLPLQETVRERLHGLLIVEPKILIATKRFDHVSHGVVSCFLNTEYHNYSRVQLSLCSVGFRNA